MNFDMWRKLIRWFGDGTAPAAETDFPGSIRITRQGNELRLTRLDRK